MPCWMVALGWHIEADKECSHRGKCLAGPWLQQVVAKTHARMMPGALEHERI